MQKAINTGILTTLKGMFLGIIKDANGQRTLDGMMEATNHSVLRALISHTS